MLGMESAVRRNEDAAWGALSDLQFAKTKSHYTSIILPAKANIITARIKTLMFSDTVLFFSYSDELDDLYAILILSAEFFKDALHKCVPIRGGIAHGNFFFNFDLGLYLGSSLIDAYHLGEESQWLGIVVDQHVYKKSKKNSYSGQRW